MAEKKQEFECNYCEKIFEDEAEYIFHKDKIRCMCDFCGEILKDYTQFEQPIYTHTTSGDIFKCWMCRVVTNDAVLMIHHIHMHQRKLFKCKTCTAKFCLKLYLADHIKEHNEHWKCDDCKFETKTLNEYEEHKRLHEKFKRKSSYIGVEYTRNGLQFREYTTTDTIFASNCDFNLF